MRQIKVTLDNGQSTIASFDESMTQDEVMAELQTLIPEGTTIVGAEQVPVYDRTQLVKSLEQKADITNTPIDEVDGKFTPVNTSQLGADRVHLSDIYAKSRPSMALNPMMEETPYEEPTVKVGSPEAKASRSFMQRMYPETAANQGYNAEGTQLFPIGQSLRDIYSLPMRAVSTGIEYAQGLSNDLFGTDFESEPDLGRTSAESVADGRTGESILTSPLLVPNLIGAIGTGGASLPTQLISGVGIGVGSGAAMTPEYGGEDVALDVALSATPALGPILAKLPINAGRKAIANALSSVGITGDAAGSIIPLIEKGGYKAGRAQGAKLSETGRRLISRDIRPHTIEQDLLTDELIAQSASDLPHMIDPKLDVSRIISGQELPKRTLAGVSADIKRLPEIKQQIGVLNNLLENNELTDAGYKAHIEQLLRDYGDIPEVRYAILADVSKGHNENIRTGFGEFFKRYRKGGAPETHTSTYTPTITEGMHLLDQGAKLANVKAPTTSPLTGLGLGDIGFGTAKKVGQKILTQPTPLLATLEARAAETTLPIGSVAAQTYTPGWIADKYR